MGRQGGKGVQQAGASPSSSQVGPATTPAEEPAQGAASPSGNVTRSAHLAAQVGGCAAGR